MKLFKNIITLNSLKGTFYFILFLLSASLSFAQETPTNSWIKNDSLNGFNEQELQHHLSNLKGTEKQKKQFAESIRKNYINEKYKLGIFNLHQEKYALKNGNPSVQTNCTNIDFEQGNTSGWTVTGDNAITSGSGTDPFGNFPVVFPGGNYSLQLSSNNLGTGTFTATASRVISVTAGNTFFSFHFAMDILDYPHDSASAARLSIQFFNSSGNLLPCPQFQCLYYQDASGTPHAVGVNNFQQTWGSAALPPGNSGPGLNYGHQAFPVTYAPWQTVGMDLTPFVGTNITCVVTCQWCIYKYDWAYCYIDADCPTSNIAPSGSCLNLPANLCGPSGMSTYNWSAPAGNSIPTATTTCISATTAGIYTLNCSLTACSTTMYTYTYNVGSSPIASFTNTPASCSGNVSFTSTSSTNDGGAIADYIWDWGDGTLQGSNLSDSHTFTGVGTHSVTLIISNGICVDSVKGTINIPPHPIVNFTTANNCLNNQSNFTSTSTATSGIFSQTWSFGDLSANGSGASSNHIYGSAGTYTVTLSVTDNNMCKDSIKVPITIYPLPIVTATGGTVCINSTVSLTSTGGASYSWSGPNSYSSTSQNPNIINATTVMAGIYTVTATDPNGCINKTAAAVTINPLPLVTALSNTPCVGSTLTLDATPGVSWNWLGPNNYSSTSQNPNIINASINMSGTYTVNALDVNNCQGTATVSVTVNPLPILSFNPSVPETCIGNSVSLTVSGASTYTWAPGGTLSSTVGAMVSASPSVYTVYTVTGTDINLCINTNTVNVVVNPLPIALFSNTSVCLGDSSIFTNLSSISSGSVSSYFWNFGGSPAGTSNTINPHYKYGQCGNYSATLVATSNKNCVSVFTKQVQVFCLPTALFSVNNICASAAAIFHNNSLNANTYSWDFNYPNAVYNTTASPSHNYPAGTYSVQLIAHTTQGCSDTVIHSLTIYPTPLANFTSDSVCLNTATTFSNLSTIAAPDNISNYFWDFNYNTGIDTTIVSPTNTYPIPGTYSVYLYVTTNHGCTDSIIKKTVVYPLPQVNFSIDSACQQSASLFTNLCSISSGNLQSWNWSFGDNNATSTAQSPVYTYSHDGSFSVTLTVASDKNCIVNKTGTAIVYPKPVANFSPLITSGCEPFTQTFIDSSLGNIVAWNWFFGDGASNNSQQNPTHTYPAVSVVTSYHPYLIVTTNKGCKDTSSYNNLVTVFPKPRAAFTITPAQTDILDPNVYISDQSLLANLIKWNLGDNDTISKSAVTNLNHTYQDTGTFIVTQYVQTNHDCWDTVSHKVIVTTDFVIYIPNAFSPNGDGINDYFMFRGIGITAYELFIFDRWGLSIFKTAGKSAEDFDREKGWDGTTSNGNQISQEDAYVYQITVTDIFHKKHKPYKGTVTLIK